MAKEKADQITAAAAAVFMRYGYRRVTMADLAEAAGMSRPALYLEFASKEQIFLAVVEKLSQENLEHVREGIQQAKTLEKKLEVAFEVWHVRPYEQIRSSPDAADLYDSVKEFAAEAISKSAAEFESVLVEVLEPAVREHKKKTNKLSAQQIARIMRASAKGFTATAKDASDLREMIRDMRRLVLSSL